MALRTSLLCMLLSFATVSSHAQSPYTDAFHTGANEYQAWAGYSPGSITWIGKSEARRMFQAGAGWRRVLLANDWIAWKYTIDIIPVALVSQPTVNGIEVVQDPKHLFFPAVCGPTSCGITIGRRTTYGAGFAPIGFEFNFRRRHRVQPVAGINAGLLRFSREVPIPNSASINFTFSLSAGVQIFTSESRSVVISYRYHHTSNADSGTPFNPGIDSNFISAGYSFHR
ncbi:MAG: hypothetical protein DMG62_08650 [Acidobacteria bacterium]|nr:MAG: hypothetical protein DMG63_12825 [Acidobacteriota bacterium]PYY23425.1 MAG: hypothetical protein DMG62_08650 [Acidobacteriota bacterium]